MVGRWPEGTALGVEAAETLDWTGRLVMAALGWELVADRGEASGLVLATLLLPPMLVMLVVDPRAFRKPPVARPDRVPPPGEGEPAVWEPSSEGAFATDSRLSGESVRPPGPLGLAAVGLAASAEVLGRDVTLTS
mmetsp:Transcript_1068/g.3271  ORF Transcript_1068/g.3271 Transcript_1068/m.3271 type:complete len:135 (+) Transcript_1068:815-1219(+)